MAHGALSLVGPQVDEIAREALQSLSTSDIHVNPPKLPYHVTVVPKDELTQLSKQQISELVADVRHVFPAGVGSSSRESGLFFVVVIWAAGQQLRKQVGLGPKQFHVTLSARDAHDVDKGIDSLLPGQLPSKPTPDFLDHLAFTLHMFSQYHNAELYSVQLIRALPDSPRGFLRLGDAALWSKKYKLAMLSYSCAWQRTMEYKVQEYCVKKMVECSKSTEWALFLDSELSQIPDEIAPLLTTPWKVGLRSRLSDLETTPTLCLETREKLSLPLLTDAGLPTY
jgi:atypical dual specificity phosphatase